MGVPCPSAGALPDEVPGPRRAPKSPALVSASDVPPVPGNPSLDLFTLPRWERTYLGVLRSLARHSPPARDGGTLPPRVPGALAVPTGCRFPDRHKPLSLCPPGRCLCPFHSWARRGSALTCARGWVSGGSRVGTAPWHPQHGFWGGGCSLQPPLLHLAASPSSQRSRHGSGSRHRETQKEEKQEGGKKYLKVQKSKKAKKKSPLLEIFFFLGSISSYISVQMLAAPRQRRAPLPLPIPRDAHPGGDAARREPSLRLQRRHPTGTRLHPSITGKRRGGGGKKGEGEKGK